MGLFSAHSADSNDPLLRPVFSARARARRLIWVLVWMFLFRTTPPPLHYWRCFLLRLFGARIGPRNAIYPTAKIWAPWNLRTGDLVTIGRGAEVYNPGEITLGDRTIISQDAYLCSATHDYQSSNFTYVTRPIVTEPHVWICARAIVLPGVRCQAGSVLGAGSVMSRDMKEWTVYAGNPAVPVRTRNRLELPPHWPAETGLGDPPSLPIALAAASLSHSQPVPPGSLPH